MRVCVCVLCSHLFVPAELQLLDTTFPAAGRLMRWLPTLPVSYPRNIYISYDVCMRAGAHVDFFLVFVHILKLCCLWVRLFIRECPYACLGCWTFLINLYFPFIYLFMKDVFINVNNLKDSIERLMFWKKVKYVLLKLYRLFKHHLLTPSL